MSTPNPRILVWNARGLNSLANRCVVYQVVVAANACIVCVQESKAGHSGE